MLSLDSSHNQLKLSYRQRYYSKLTTMNKIKSFFTVFYFASAIAVSAQHFTIRCDTANYLFLNTPYIRTYDNLFALHMDKTIEFNRSGSGFEGSISVTRPYFIQLVNTPLLAIPNQKVTGTLKMSADEFIINDTNNINALLLEFETRCLNMSMQYNSAAPFTKFITLYDSVHRYVDAVIKYISIPASKQRYNINNEALSAVRQFCMTRLALFSLLPVFLKGKYDEELFKIIRRDIKINDPSFWLQRQEGRGFLKTYFSHVIRLNKYDVEKTLSSDVLFTDMNVKKFVQYQYFYSLLNDSLIGLSAISKQLSEFESKYSFTAEENKNLQQLKSKFSLTGKNIITLFSKQVLINNNGEILGNEKDALLKNKGKVLVYYWASWCIPCIETISKLKSGEITYKGESYKLLFISSDKQQKDWLKKNYPVLNTGNSFRLANLKDPSFYSAMQIEAIPRLFLIDNGVLIHQNFPVEKLKEMW